MYSFYQFQLLSVRLLSARNRLRHYGTSLLKGHYSRCGLTLSRTHFKFFIGQAGDVCIVQRNGAFMQERRLEQAPRVQLAQGHI